MSRQGNAAHVNPTVLRMGQLSLDEAGSRGTEPKKHVQAKMQLSELDQLSVSPLLLTNRVALDCEMVGVGIDAKEHMLARVSLVNEHGVVLVDCHVKPQRPVKDYRTQISGIHPEQMEAGYDFAVIRELVRQLIRGRILVGHALRNDLAVLKLGHPKYNIRDTSRYKPICKKIHAHGTPSLKTLTKQLLGKDIQEGTHDSVEDARAAMKIYLLFEEGWEKSVKQSRKY
ncbi:RNA exonuclease 4-like [Anopheles albimanus]|uniref:RNA exonuclease 4-like n=1 Tax=Anopheles albimanus TaxID=7167 RepID=UPI00163FDCDA|nr:RNA exonuclease 4-like [Anopheles albimanus]